MIMIIMTREFLKSPVSSSQISVLFVIVFYKKLVCCYCWCEYIVGGGGGCWLTFVVLLLLVHGCISCGQILTVADAIL